MTAVGTTPAEAGAGDVGHALAELLAAVELAESTRLARAGRYAEADAALSTARTAPKALDLRARMAAQQGRFDEAADLWRLAADQMGEPGAFAAELALVTGTHPRRPRSRAWTAGLAVAVVAGGLAAGLVGGALVDDDPPSSSSSAAALGRFREDLLAALDERLDQVAAADVPQPQPDDAAGTPGADAVDAVEGRLRAVPGVEVSRRGDVLDVRFTAPAFGEATTLTPSGRAALEGLAAALLPDADRRLLVVTGHTDALPLRPGSPFSDNLDLAISRARSGAEVLQAAGLPGSAITASVTPAPGDETAGAENRTLTVAVYERTAPEAG